jgi:hypothetical protein
MIGVTSIAIILTLIGTLCSWCVFITLYLSIFLVAHLFGVYLIYICVWGGGVGGRVCVCVRACVRGGSGGVVAPPPSTHSKKTKVYNSTYSFTYSIYLPFYHACMYSCS